MCSLIKRSSLQLLQNKRVHAIPIIHQRDIHKVQIRLYGLKKNKETINREKAKAIQFDQPPQVRIVKPYPANAVRNLGVRVLGNSLIFLDETLSVVLFLFVLWDSEYLQNLKYLWKTKEVNNFKQKNTTNFELLVGTPFLLRLIRTKTKKEKSDFKKMYAILVLCWVLGNKFLQPLPDLRKVVDTTVRI